MARVRVQELLDAPVLLHGIQLGRPVDAVLDRDVTRVLGLEVHCGDELRRFLPFAVAHRRETGIELVSPLVMLESSELAFYMKRGATTLGALRRTHVAVRGEVVGTLDDLVLDEAGVIVDLVVETADGRRRIPFGPLVAFAPGRPGARAAS